jgi:hypothetical protein
MGWRVPGHYNRICSCLLVITGLLKAESIRQTPKVKAACLLMAGKTQNAERKTQKAEG